LTSAKSPGHVTLSCVARWDSVCKFNKSCCQDRKNSSVQIFNFCFKKSKKFTNQIDIMICCLKGLRQKDLQTF
jgi:hypothetical protein